MCSTVFHTLGESIPIECKDGIKLKCGDYHPLYTFSLRTSAAGVSVNLTMTIMHLLLFQSIKNKSGLSKYQSILSHADISLLVNIVFSLNPHYYWFFLCSLWPPHQSRASTRISRLGLSFL